MTLPGCSLLCQWAGHPLYEGKCVWWKVQLVTLWFLFRSRDGLFKNGCSEGKVQHKSHFVQESQFKLQRRRDFKNWAARYSSEARVKLKWRRMILDLDKPVLLWFAFLLYDVFENREICFHIQDTKHILLTGLDSGSVRMLMKTSFYKNAALIFEFSRFFLNDLSLLLNLNYL